jgi:hypothetical protein
MAQVTIGLDEGSTTTARAITEVGGAKVPVAAQAFNDGSDHPTQVSTAAPLPVVQTGTPGLPTGASTSALQTTGNTSLATLVTNSPALGQALAAASVPVILPSATITTLTPPSNTGYSTSALQTTGNSSLSSIDGKTPSLGQALAAASVPVVLTAAQMTTLTPLSTVTTTPPSNASSNVAQINGVTPLMGNGVTGTGSQRVTIASDNTAFAVNSTLSAETTKVIGTVNVAASQTIATTNAGTFAVQNTAVPQTLASGTISTAMTGTTSTSLIGATASNYIYITQVTVSNSHATVGTDVVLQDGSGGTTLYVIPAAAVYGGATVTFPKDAPLKVPTVGNALYCANVTTGASTKVSASGWKSTVSY